MASRSARGPGIAGLARRSASTVEAWLTVTSLSTPSAPIWRPGDHESLQRGAPAVERLHERGVLARGAGDVRVEPELDALATRPRLDRTDGAAQDHTKG
jgi:hypothetical protein